MFTVSSVKIRHKIERQRGLKKAKQQNRCSNAELMSVLRGAEKPKIKLEPGERLVRPQEFKNSWKIPTKSNN